MRQGGLSRLGSLMPTMEIPRDYGAAFWAVSYFGHAVDRVLRGGSWNNNHDNAACAYRNNNNPHNRNNNTGFRCAKTLLAFAAVLGGSGRIAADSRTAAECVSDVQTAGPAPAWLQTGQR